MNYAVIGTNWLCENYRSAIREAGDTFYAVLSRDMERAKAFSQGEALPYDSMDALLADDRVDAVYLCLPNSMHHEAAIRALRAGKHVLCEKPFALTLQQSEEMFREADKAGKVLAEGVMSFYSPAMEEIRSYVKQDSVVSARLDYSQRSSKLDKVRAGAMVSSFDRRLGGGVLYDLGIYPIHFAVNLFGAPKTVTAKARWLGDVDVTDVIVLGYGDFDITVTVSKAGQSFIGSEILMDRGTLTFDNVSVVLGAKYVTKAGAKEISCGDGGIPLPGTNPSEEASVQTRVIRRFTKWMQGEDRDGLLRLKENSLIVQKILEEARAQIGYTL